MLGQYDTQENNCLVALSVHVHGRGAESRCSEWSRCVEPPEKKGVRKRRGRFERALSEHPVQGIPEEWETIASMGRR